MFWRHLSTMRRLQTVIAVCVIRGALCEKQCLAMEVLDVSGMVVETLPLERNESRKCCSACSAGLVYGGRWCVHSRDSGRMLKVGPRI